MEEERFFSVTEHRANSRECLTKHSLRWHTLSPRHIFPPFSKYSLLVVLFSCPLRPGHDTDSLISFLPQFRDYDFSLRISVAYYEEKNEEKWEWLRVILKTLLFINRMLISQSELIVGEISGNDCHKLE